MKRRVLKNLTGGLAVLSLVACLAAPILFFLGRISETSYKTVFLIASIAWFFFAIARGMAGKDPAAGRTTP